MLCNEIKGSAADKANVFPDGERHSFHEKISEVSYGGASGIEPLTRVAQIIASPKNQNWTVVQRIIRVGGCKAGF
jgi:hypothetical protein